MSPAPAFDRLKRELGELVERHDRGRDLSELGVYQGRVLGFAREVLGVEFWSVQEEIGQSAMTDPRLCLVGGNAVGKDFACAVLALYAAFVEGALVLITAATQRQTREIAMGTIRRLWARSDLPGEAFIEALRIPGLDEAGILAFTSTESGKYTGFHAPKVWAVLMEAQALPEHAFEGLFSCATGPEDRVIVHGNPLFPTGRLVQLAKSDGWRTFTIPATSHPNITGAEPFIPGGPSAEWIEHMRATYGEDSNLFKSRVEALFPTSSEEGLFSVEMLSAAAERCEALRAEHMDAVPVAALDVARLGPDRSVLAVRRGPVVVEVLTWHRLVTTDLVDRLRPELWRLGFRTSREAPKASPGERGVIIVDEIGMGGPVLDTLRQLGYRVDGFNGGRKAKDAERFANVRSSSYWHLRDLLEKGRIGIPEDEGLWAELLATSWRPDPSGRIQLEAKDDLKSRLGRSPDHADAVSMLFSGYGLPGPPVAKATIVTHGKYVWPGGRHSWQRGTGSGRRERFL